MLKPFALSLVFVLAQAGAKPPLPATYVTAAEIQTNLKAALASKTTDTPIRTVDAGGHNVGVGIVQRAKSSGAGMLGSASHDQVTEVYQILEGRATLVTGGTLTEPQRRGQGATQVVSINGPGVSGKAIAGGVSHAVAKGDMVIIPAGTPHWFSEIQENLVYTVVRVDPARVVTLK
jgi:mannose-6-phosphate isomerase-like protein (cupin superfamily)